MSARSFEKHPSQMALFDCSGEPNFPPGINGDWYVVNVAGKIGGASGTTVAIGTIIRCKADNVGGTLAAVGSSWGVNEVTGTSSIIGAEGGAASLVLSADEADNTADSWTIASTAANDLEFTRGDLANISVKMTASSLSVTGIEGGNATLTLKCDEGDDAIDQWSLESNVTANNLLIINGSSTVAFLEGTGAMQVGVSHTVLGASSGNASLILDADNSDDAADKWTLESNATTNNLNFKNDTTAYMALSPVGDLTLQGILTPIGGLTAGYINVGETKFCTTLFDVDSGTTGTTLTDIVGLTGFTLAASGVYEFEVFINGTATGNGGHKIAIKLTTATLTSANVGALAILSATMAYTQSTTATDPVPLHAATTATLGLIIKGRIIVATGGTCSIQAAQNASHADNTQVYVGSYARFTRIS